MPRLNKRQRDGVILPDWLEKMLDKDLAIAVIDALGARHFAERAGAERDPKAQKTFQRADRIIGRIANGELRSEIGRRQAESAAKSYERACEIATVEEPLHSSVKRNLQQWLSRLPKNERKDILTDLLAEDAA